MILDTIVADKRRRLAVQEKEISLQQMKILGRECKREIYSFMDALKKPCLSIIGEFKNASPSLGKIDSSINLEKRMEEYQASVDAVSCLTEEDHFSGSINDFKKIRKMVNIPMLRKDFMISDYQFYEARAIGADAVLLIAAILEDGELREFYQLSRELQMDALVEVHDETEMERALKSDARIIGINNRNLKDFSIRLETTKRLAKMVPRDKILVSESGILGADDVKYLRESGADALLIGRALMEAKSPMETAGSFRLLG